MYINLCTIFVCIKSVIYLYHMKKMLSIGEAANVLGVTTTMMRNWDKKGLLKPDELTKGGDRRYRLESLKHVRPNLNYTKDHLKTIAYTRVSSHDQKEDLVRQVAVLESYCASKGYANCELKAHFFRYGMKVFP